MFLLLLFVLSCLSIGRGQSLSPCQQDFGSAGVCRAAINRWSYKINGTCLPFVWGGCGGSANNFASEYDCQTRSVPHWLCCGDGWTGGRASGLVDCLSAWLQALENVAKITFIVRCINAVTGAAVSPDIASPPAWQPPADFVPIMVSVSSIGQQPSSHAHYRQISFRMIGLGLVIALYLR